MDKTAYFAVTVRKFSVLSRHRDRMEKTQELYNEILGFYYRLYLDTLPETGSGSMETMRSLEKMTIVGRNREPVPHPLPWKKVPLYFRRAAINGAVAAARSYLARDAQKEESRNFTESVTFYKGMYRDFSENGISLKLWDGDSWKWIRLRLRGNKIPEEGQMMSPALVLREKKTELHIPWKTPVCDGRNAKERMKAGENICSAVFTNRDACVVCCILDSGGKMTDSLFLKGGTEYSHQCSYYLKKLKKSQASKGAGNNPRGNAKYWEKLKNISDNYAHQISRQVIDYCKKNHVGVLVLPYFEQNHRNIIMHSSGRYSPIYLSTSVREKLKYKAWQAGIVVLEAQQHKVSSVCSICGSEIRQSGTEFFCEKGHRGNRYLNTARNLGLKCLNDFQSKQKSEHENC